MISLAFHPCTVETCSLAVHGHGSPCSDSEREADLFFGPRVESFGPSSSSREVRGLTIGCSRVMEQRGCHPQQIRYHFGSGGCLTVSFRGRNTFTDIATGRGHTKAWRCVFEHLVLQNQLVRACGTCPRGVWQFCQRGAEVSWVDVGRALARGRRTCHGWWFRMGPSCREMKNLKMSESFTLLTENILTRTFQDPLRP